MAADLVQLLEAGRFGDPALGEVGAFIGAFRNWGEQPDAQKGRVGVVVGRVR
jgi:hypothetical protein